jgi:hypothetical protein
MVEQRSQSRMGAWTAGEKLFAIAALVCAVMTVYAASAGGRFALFAAGTFAFSISWWSARRARIKGDLPGIRHSGGA